MTSEQIDKLCILDDTAKFSASMLQEIAYQLALLNENRKPHMDACECGHPYTVHQNKASHPGSTYCSACTCGDFRPKQGAL